jgi:hypothetical protein
MTNTITKVREHYNATALTDANALMPLDPRHREKR